MNPLRFHGYSDDTFGEYGRTKDDFDNCASGKPIDWAVTDASGCGVLVSGQYGKHNSCWSIAVTPWSDEEEPATPPWPMRIEPPTGEDTPYSPVLVIEAPEGVTVRCLQRSEGGA